MSYPPELDHFAPAIHWPSGDQSANPNPSALGTGVGFVPVALMIARPVQVAYAIWSPVGLHVASVPPHPPPTSVFFPVPSALRATRFPPDVTANRSPVGDHAGCCSSEPPL